MNMTITSEYIEECLQNGTFFQLLTDSLQIEHTDKEFKIKFPSWLNLLEEDFRVLIIEKTIKNFPQAFELSHPNSKNVKITDITITKQE